MRLLKRIFKLLLISFFIALLLGVGYYFFVTSGVSLSPEKLALSAHSVTIYDEDGNAVTAGSSGLAGNATAFESIPTHTKNAFIATEDKRFYSHNGFDYKRIVKSLYNNLKAGSLKQGASTISQQLIKNTHLTHERTLKRKLREFKLTRQLEKRYSKDEILHKYLSVIYFGHDCFGLNSAARFYFDKSVEELDIADSAILAGLVKSPNNYSPFQNPEACLRRKQSVLRFMKKNGFIDDTQVQTAMKKPLPLPKASKLQTRGFAKCVFNELSALAELRQFRVAGRVEIDTYLNANLQEKAESVVQDGEKNATVAVLDTATRGVKAYASNAGNIKRLPGSLLKPLLVYAPALEENLISPATPLLDEKISYGGYSPNNYDGKCHGYTSARECLANSLNIPAVKLLDSLGVDKAVPYLEKMRLSVGEDEKTLALALGGMKNGYGLLELLSAYAVFPNDGVYQGHGFIKAIRLDGATVYTRQEKSVQVFSPDTAYLTTDMLKTTAKTGTAKKLRSLPIDIAAKTGTAGTENGNTDAYALSYTTRDIVGVWHGDAKGGFIHTTGGGLPCNGLLSVNEFLCKEYESKKERISPFEKPTGVTSVELDKFAYEKRHSLICADPLSPLNGKFCELFKNGAIPLQVSDLYSNPTPPSVEVFYQNGVVRLRLEEDFPLPYLYRIERCDTASGKRVTIYEGGIKKEVVDDTIMQNKKYIYTITPSCNGRKGKAFATPAVNTKIEEKPSPNDKKIVEKDWWDY